MNLYSKISDLSSNLNTKINTKENILTFSNPLTKNSNNVSIDLSNYYTKSSVDGSINSINTNKDIRIIIVG